MKPSFELWKMNARRLNELELEILLLNTRVFAFASLVSQQDPALYRHYLQDTVRILKSHVEIAQAHEAVFLYKAIAELEKEIADLME